MDMGPAADVGSIFSTDLRGPDIGRSNRTESEYGQQPGLHLEASSRANMARN